MNSNKDLSKREIERLNRLPKLLKADKWVVILVVGFFAIAAGLNFLLAMNSGTW